MAKILLLLVCSLFVSVATEAQCMNAANGCAQTVPHLVKFSGTLKNISGAPPVVAIRFVIYGDATGGTPLWQEVQNAQIDQQGHYDVMLGATASEGVPVSLFATGETRWLGVQALLPGQEELPRVLLVSVPYALQAENAETLGGWPASAFAKAGAASAVVSSAPPETVAGTSVAVPATGVIANATSGAAVTITGATVNTISKFSSSSSLTDSQITDQNGIVSMANLSNILFADIFTGGVWQP